MANLIGRVDELGFGVLNVNRFIKKYAGTVPQFIEGNLFKTVIPVSEGLNEGLKSLLDTVLKNPGIKAKDLPALLNDRPPKTIERQIKELVFQDRIERRGSRKTGGYYFKDKS